MSAAEERIRSVHSRRTVLTPRSAIAFARGARTGVRMIFICSEVNTASKSATNCVAIANQEAQLFDTIIEVHEQIAGCWVTHARSGWP